MSTEALLRRNLPKITLCGVERIVADLYGLSGRYKQLVSERDLSWRIVDDQGQAFVLKISNSAEPEGVVDMQVKALEHVAARDPELPVPRMIHTREGKSYDWIESDSGKRHMIRLLTYLQGDVMEGVPAAYSARTRFNIGALVGRLTQALRNFFHPYAASNLHLWDISRCLELRPQIEHLPDPELRDLCHSIMDRAQHFTLPQLKNTRWQLVHQDGHGGNVLIDPENPSKPVGIIDFGDMGYNSIVTEIVVACETFAEWDDDPIAYLCDVAAGFDSSYPLEEDEIDLIYDAMLLRLAMSTIIVGSRELYDEEEIAHIESAGFFPRMMKLLHQQGREQAIRRLREACRFPVYYPRKAGDEVFADHHAELFHKREAKLGSIWHFYGKAMHFTRARGAWMYAADGTGYLDTYNNVPQMGHSHPHIARAIARQALVLNTNTRYLCDIAADYAERLTADLPEHLDTCIFVNSGSEANDLAMQIAKSLSGHQGGLIIDQAYHGCTELTTALSHESWGHLPKELHPHNIETLMIADSYKGPYAGDPEAAHKYAADADRAIADLAKRGHKPAAFMVDTAMCAHGLAQPPKNYFNLVAEKTRAAGGYVIADEVQAGCGRMGTFWGFRANGLKDENIDFITMGKPVGNAHPLGVIILSSRMMNQFVNGTHPLLFSTFGGNAVACAAGMAVLDVIERENLLEKANEVGDYLRAELHRLATRHPLIGDVRGRGMMIGLELVTDRATKTPAAQETKKLIEEMLARRVLVGSSSTNVLKLRPSLAWNKEEVDFFIQALDRSLAAVA